MSILQSAAVAVVDTIESHPVIAGAIVAAGGASSLWFTRTLLEVRDGMRTVTQAIYGPPDAKEPNGMKREIRHLQTSVMAVDSKVDARYLDLMAAVQRHADIATAVTSHQQTEIAVVVQKIEALESKIDRRKKPRNRGV